MADRTVIYYTSSHEDQAFEGRVIADLLTKVSDLPIISVSQKPLELGHNICVGEVGLSYVNQWHQVLLCAKAATTPYLVTAESDFLYPEEYFRWEPPGGDCWRYDNIWVVWSHRSRRARRKTWSEGAMVVRRDWYISFLEAFLARYPTWTTEHVRLPSVAPFEMFHGEVPCVTFKTGNGVRFGAGTYGRPAWEIPYWGLVDDIRRKYLGESFAGRP